MPKLISLNQLKTTVERLMEVINKRIIKPTVDGTEDQILSLNASGETVWVDNIEVIDNLTSSDVDKALSVNQGKVIVDEWLGGKKLKYLTQAEYDLLSDAEKSDTSISYIITDATGSTSDIEVIDNLTSTDTDKALSANQGKVIVDEWLGGKKLKYLTQAEYDLLSDAEKQSTDVIYNITDFSEEYITKSEIIDNLTSTDTDKALSANQGKVLNDKIGDIDSLLDSLNGEVI